VENQAKELSNFVSARIHSILKRDESYIRASLARLRRGIGKKPGSLPDIWDFTLKDLPDIFLSATGVPTYGEWAAHMSITMFALHQQGKDPQVKPMFVASQSLGNAVRALVSRRGESSEESIKRRFDAVVTSNTPEEVAHHLRGLIQMLRSEGIPLDYAQLAEDLFRFQLSESRDGVKLRWGQDYSKIRKDDNNEH